MVDLGAEKLIAAEKGKQKIAVEVKSFIGRSPMTDLEKALGQYILYASIFQQDEPDRIIYLAIDTLTHTTLFAEPIGQLLLENTALKLVVFNAETQEITRWID